MASSSTYGEYYDLSLTYAGNDNNPLSACYCFDLVNNLEHLRDMRSQYRVNWVHPPSYNTSTFHHGVYFDGTGATYQHAFTHIYPWNRSHKGGPLTPVLFIRGQGMTTSDTLYLVTYMMGHQHGIGNRGADEAIYSAGRAFKWSGNVGGTTVSNIIAAEGSDKTDDPDFIFDATWDGSASFDTWDIDSDGNTNYFNTNITLYKLSVYGMGRGYITGVSLREFNE